MRALPYDGAPRLTWSVPLVSMRRDSDPPSASSSRSESSFTERSILPAGRLRQGSALARLHLDLGACGGCRARVAKLPWPRRTKKTKTEMRRFPKYLRDAVDENVWAYCLTCKRETQNDWYTIRRQYAGSEAVAKCWVCGNWKLNKPVPRKRFSSQP